MKKLLLIVFAIVLSVSAYAQDFQAGRFVNEEIQMTKYNKDTTAHAVVLQEFGKTWISSADHVPLIHEYHVKIKIFDTKGFDEANVSVGLYHRDENSQSIRDIKGITFYKDENGLIRKAELDPKKIFTEKRDNRHDRIKFTLPNLTPGCIIEYSYVLESPYPDNFFPWDFQTDIPKVYSEYEAHIPAIYEYNILLRGGLKLAKNTAELERECFSYYGTKADCSKITYAMRDIPAFVGEKYMTAPVNYISALYFEMSAYTNQNGIKKKLTQEWADVDRDLKSTDMFGGQMKRTGLMKDRIPAKILAEPDTLTKAQAIYTFMQKWFKWDGKYNHIYSDDGIKKALDSHSGNVGDVNLSLISALNTAGIIADAVILSTRENGIANKLFPQTSEFDYVVARVNIGNKIYMLDATDPLLAFGMLPLRCINDQGRVMSLNKPSYWIDMFETQKSATTSTLDLTLQNDGKIKGTITTFYTGYSAYEKRHAIKKFNSTDEYVENLDERLPKIKITKSDLSNLDSLNMPVVEKYDVIIDGYTSLNHESIDFNPAFWDKETENPFKLAERSYPVDMGSTTDHRLILTLHFPEGFVAGKLPDAVAIGLPNKGGRFITNIELGENTISYSQIEQFTKSIYQPEEYPYLKELYNKIIQNQKATIVFTKKP
ncbi:MAG: DUF3857 domain-containing protein [Mucilaginibacter sp.]|uniref:DUF3857 domain-containing protein n=1 Tax=Mucilaginibacter sp. TaxID=1882438 RepID=UPI003262DDF0